MSYFHSVVYLTNPTFWNQVAFSTTIPLNDNSYMPLTPITGATTFTPNTSTKMPGGFCYLSLVANGTDTPVFSGMSEIGNSAGWNNTANIVNYVQVYYDGSAYKYSIWQNVNAQPVDVTAPILTSAVINNAQPTLLVMTFNENLANVTPSISAFTVLKNSSAITPSNIALSSAMVTLTIASVTSNDSITVAYTQPGSNKLQDASGNFVASFTAQNVTNNVAPAGVPANTVLPTISGTTTQGQVLTASTGTWSNTPTSYAYQWKRNGTNISGATTSTYTLVSGDVGTTITVAVTATNGSGSSTAISNGTANIAASGSSDVFIRLSGLNGLVESINGGGGYNYTAQTTDNSYATNFGGSTVGLAANADGYIGMSLSSLQTPGSLIGFSANSSAGNYLSFDYGILSDNASGSYQKLTSGVTAAVDTPTAQITGDKIRIRRVGSTIYGEIARSGSNTYTVINTWNSASTAKMYCHIQSTSASTSVVAPFGSSNIA